MIPIHAESVKRNLRALLNLRVSFSARQQSAIACAVTANEIVSRDFV